MIQISTFSNETREIKLSFDDLCNFILPVYRNKIWTSGVFDVCYFLTFFIFIIFEVLMLVSISYLFLKSRCLPIKSKKKNCFSTINLWKIHRNTKLIILCKVRYVNLPLIYLYTLLTIWIIFYIPFAVII